MSDADLRPPGGGGPRPVQSQVPVSNARWWEPLTTKWGLLGILIFLGLVMGVWQSAKESILPTSTNTLKPGEDIGPQISKLEQSCKKIENFAERIACEKPIEDWRAQQKAKKEEQRRIEQTKQDEERRKEQAYEAYRKILGMRDQLKQPFVDMISKDTRPSGDWRPLEKAIDDIAKFYDQNPTLRPPVTLRTHEISAELENIDVMPFENAATLIIQYAGQADERTVKKALRDLRLDRALKKPELIGVIEEGKNRRPYFPEVPTLSALKNYTSIDNKPPTPDVLREYQGRDQKWELQRAIIGIYRDCEEHFRPLYTQHIKTLLQQYVSTQTMRVESPPQELTYPLYLLENGTTPNERLGGALVILWQGQITPWALQRINETPDAVFANGCPADRKKFRLVGSSRIPAEADMIIKNDIATFTKADLPRTVMLLGMAYEKCLPSSRSFYTSYVRRLSTTVASLKDRRAPMPADASLLERLKSKDRKTQFQALEEVFKAPAISANVAATLPEAGTAVFYDHCPGIQPDQQLEAFRAERNQDEARLEKFRREDADRQKTRR